MKPSTKDRIQGKLHEAKEQSKRQQDKSPTIPS